jgi:hypothetical protein
MFRLSAAPDDFDKAEFSWRESMNTIRTGRPWTPEDPNLKPDPSQPQRTQLPPPVVTKPNSLDGKEKIVKPPVSVSATVAGRKVEIRLPSDWAGKVGEDGQITLTHPEVTNAVILSLASSLDSDPPQKALLLASSKTLGDFEKVTKRDETVPDRNRAGATVASVWRSGSGIKGDLFTCNAVVVSGDNYALISYRCVDMGKIGNERKLVESLLNSCTIELVP